jgi:hypothetical protein
MLELPPHGRVLTVALKPRRAKANDAAEQVDLRDGNVVDPFR